MPRALLCAGLLIAAPAFAPPALAQSDTTPPVLNEFAFSPVSIDTSTGPATVLVTFRAADSTGVASVRATFSNREVASDPRGCEATTPETGSAQDGVYRCAVEFPQFSSGGTWRVLVVELVDTAGNADLLSTGRLEGLGFPTDLLVFSSPDAAPPVLAGFGFLPRAIDTTGGDGTVRVTFHVTDDRSGVSWAKASFLDPGPMGVVRGCTSLVVAPGGEPALDVGLTCDVVIPGFSTEGAWSVYGVDLADAAGNNRRYSAAGLVALGFPADLLVTSQPDTAPPALLDFGFAPAAIDTADADAPVSARFEVRDDLAGVASAEAVFVAPGAPAQTRDCTSATPDSGSSLEGTYRCTVLFLRHTAEGTWTVARVVLRDATGNNRSYATADLAQAGFPVDLSVGFTPGAPRAAIVAPGEGRSIRGDSVTVAARLVQGDPSGVSSSHGVRLEYRPTPFGNFAPIPARDPSQPNPDLTYPYLIHWDLTGPPAGTYELRAVAHDAAGTPDPAPGTIAVGVADGGGVDVDEWVNASGEQEARFVLDGLVSGVAASGGRGPRGALAAITLPPGALDQPVDAIRLLHPGGGGELSRLEQPDQGVGVFVDLSLESGQIALRQGLTAGIELHYTDVNQDGVVDGTRIREEDLELRRLESAVGTYVKLPPWTVLTEHNIVHGLTTALGRFALTGPLEPRIRLGADARTLTWDPVSEALSYSVYRGDLAGMRDADGDGLPDGAYGVCQNHRDADRTDTMFDDGDVPSGPGEGFFYLVTYEGPEGERGLGTTSAGIRRRHAFICP